MAAFSSLFVQATITQNTTVLQRCRPRTIDTAICAYRNVSGSVSELVLPGTCHFLAVLHKSLKKLFLACLVALQW